MFNLHLHLTWVAGDALAAAPQVAAQGVRDCLVVIVGALGFEHHREDRIHGAGEVDDSLVALVDGFLLDG